MPLTQTIYYADGSDVGPTDSSGHWTDDANAFDGSDSTYARATGGTGYLSAEGTNAPADNPGYGLITAVAFRFKGTGAGGSPTQVVCYEDNVGGTTLSTATEYNETATWADWAGLTPPSGGWTWAKVQSLAFECRPAEIDDDIYKIEIRVNQQITFNNFWGAETGGMEEATSYTGASAVSSPVKSGNYAYLVDDTTEFTVSPFESVASGGTGCILGFNVRFASASTDSGSTNNVMVRVAEDILGTLSLVQPIGSKNIQIRAADGSTVIRTLTDPFPDADTDYFVELYFENLNSGDSEIFINGVSWGADSGSDFLASSGDPLDSVKFGGLERASSNNTYYDDIYFISGANAASDRLGACEVFAYLGETASPPSVTADWIKGSDGDLNSGTWENTQEIPFNESNVGVYSDTTARAGGLDTSKSGSAGPSGDSNIDGDSNIRAMKGLWRMKRSGGSGAVHYGLMGNTGSNVTDSDRSADLDPTNSYVTYYDIRDDNLPLSTEYGRIGIEKDGGGQDFDCADMLFQILHVPSPVRFPPIDIVKAAYQHILVR
jgi:hypothetical protein